MSFGRLDRAAGTQPMSDINMTPLIDVMLVLLVIFMITAPLMTSSLRLDLPKTAAGQPNEAPQSIAVALDPQGRTYIGDEVVDAATLSARMAEVARKNPQAEVQLRADRSVPYGRVAELIGLVQQAGLSRIGFVTDPGREVLPGATDAADAKPPSAPLPAAGPAGPSSQGGNAPVAPAPLRP